MKVTIRYTGEKDLRVVTERIKRAQDDIAARALDLYQETVETFEHKPDFSIVEHNVDGKRRLNVYARRGGIRVNPKLDTWDMYHNLDIGFLRKVKMTKDFTAKTMPGQLRPGIGSGGVAMRGDIKVYIPPTRVEARLFTKQIASQLRPIWEQMVRDALNSSG